MSSNSGYYVDGISQNVVASPALIQDQISIVSYVRSSDTVGDSITITLGIKLVSGGIPIDGGIFINFPLNFMILSSNLTTTLLNSNIVLAKTYMLYTGTSSIS